MDIKYEQHGSSENNRTIIELLLTKGELVKKGQLLLVIELDKKNLEIEFPINGNIKEIFFR
jgi:pyruvate/2-oxoglutarate dehydrogenase complex dihydrolipoamide acyltransferase (E2) component|tara:strand:- start:387 stop:569 length:183 start_codon:yes stop_codon:yes gene_type:complete